MNENFVRQFLETAAREIGMGGLTEEFTERVMARLAKGAVEYGAENYLRAPLETLEREGGEEGTDLAGWSVACAARVMSDLTAGLFPDDEVADEKQRRYLRAAGLGLLAWAEYEAARSAV